MKRSLDPVLWRRLHEEHIGLWHTWHVKDRDIWYAYAVYPWLPDVDDGPCWDDDRATLMQTGSTLEEAVEKLFSDPRLDANKDGLGRAIIKLTCEVMLLTSAIHDRLD